MSSWRLGLGAGLAGLAVTITGGYGLGWRWTGFQANGNLWDWLHLLLLPIVLSGLPIWIKTHRTDRRRWRLALGSAGLGLLILIAGGSGLGWSWTGFQGNRLWDWLHLLVLPIVVGLSPLWLARHRGRGLGPLGVALLTLGGIALAVALAGGYGLGWTWTGFQGNRLWDWIELLLVPVLVPVVFSWLSLQLADRVVAGTAGTGAPPSAGPPPTHEAPAEGI
ncbi:MAG TPA: hypothetical protein VI138_04440 [Candidatus Dormibacteraeota bacterium]